MIDTLSPDIVGEFLQSSLLRAGHCATLRRNPTRLRPGEVCVQGLAMIYFTAKTVQLFRESKKNWPISDPDLMNELLTELAIIKAARDIILTRFKAIGVMENATALQIITQHYRFFLTSSTVAYAKHYGVEDWMEVEPESISELLMVLAGL